MARIPRASRTSRAALARASPPRVSRERYRSDATAAATAAGAVTARRTCGPTAIRGCAAERIELARREPALGTRPARATRRPSGSDARLTGAPPGSATTTPGRPASSARRRGRRDLGDAGPVALHRGLACHPAQPLQRASRPRSPSQRTTARSVRSGTMRSTPSSTSWWVDLGAVVALRRRERDRQLGRARRLLATLAGRDDRDARRRRPRRSASGTQRPAPSASTTARRHRAGAPAAGDGRRARRSGTARSPVGSASTNASAAAPAAAAQPASRTMPLTDRRTPTAAWRRSPVSGGSISSPRSDANCASSSASSAESLCGTSTLISTMRSPRPRPLSTGTPRPRRRSR